MASQPNALVRSSAVPSISIPPAPERAPFQPLAEYLPPITAAEKAVLDDAHAHVCGAVKSMRSSQIELAYYGWRIQKSQRWAEFGCRNQAEYLDKFYIPSHAWSHCVRVGRVLESLPFDELSRIGIAKALHIARINPDIWHDYDWLAEARTMGRSKFGMLVTARNAALDGGEQSEALQLADKRKVTRAELRRIRKEHGLPSTEDAIAVALDGGGGSQTAQLFAACKHAVKLLSLVRQEMKKLKTKSVPRQEALRLTIKAQERLRESIKVAVGSAEVGVPKSVVQA
jgi:hypothetical protein